MSTPAPSPPFIGAVHGVPGRGQVNIGRPRSEAAAYAGRPMAAAHGGGDPHTRSPRRGAAKPRGRHASGETRAEMAATDRTGTRNNNNNVTPTTTTTLFAGGGGVWSWWFRWWRWRCSLVTARATVTRLARRSSISRASGGAAAARRRRFGRAQTPPPTPSVARRPRPTPIHSLIQFTPNSTTISSLSTSITNQFHNFQNLTPKIQKKTFILENKK